MPQLARRESGEKSGPAGEARDHCFRMWEDRGFLLFVPTDSRAPPKKAPETGRGLGYHLRAQRWAQTTNAASAAIRNPVHKCRSLRTPPWEPVQHTTARVS